MGIAVAAVASALQRSGVKARHGKTATQLAALDYGEDLSIAGDAYIVLGVSHCFEQGANKKLQDVWTLEPMTASTVEVINNGAQTSFESFMGTTASKILAKDLSDLPESLFCGHTVRWADKLEFRTGCAARTWMRDHARTVVRKLAPDGEVKTGFNTSTEHKRILNFIHVVNDSDNVKQDMSIDVYGREGEDTKVSDEQKQIAEMYNA